jgi:shikimate dehydrogenase
MRLAVLGDPVSHSLSPLLHNAALAAAGIPGIYEAHRADSAAMEAAVADIRTGALDGANVTMPHKRLAAELVDDRTVPAQRTGAVNTITRVAGRAVGHNTDIAGVLHAATWAGLPPEAPVLVLGAGGAAAAALVAFEDRSLTISSRNHAAAESLAADLGIVASTVPFGEPVDGAVVINATPLGMRGETLPPNVLDGASGLLDMAYGAEDTPAVEQIRQRGLPVADGPSMLLGQAVESFRLWTGRAPLGAMRAALHARRSAGAAA